jgi:hypothetical protein
MLGESAPLQHEELFSDQFFLFFGEEARWLCETWKLMKIAMKLVHQHLSLSHGRARGKIRFLQAKCSFTDEEQ